MKHHADHRIIQRQTEANQFPTFPVAENTVAARRHWEFSLNRAYDKHHFGAFRPDSVRVSHQHFVKPLRNACHSAGANNQIQKLCISLTRKFSLADDKRCLVKNTHQKVPCAELSLGQHRVSVLFELFRIFSQMFRRMNITEKLISSCCDLDSFRISHSLCEPLKRFYYYAAAFVDFFQPLRLLFIHRAGKSFGILRPFLTPLFAGNVPDECIILKF
ncbi:MAG: hypothetical protein ACFWUD_00005 [Thermocaproicibacter melissae]